MKNSEIIKYAVIILIAGAGIYYTMDQSKTFKANVDAKLKLENENKTRRAYFEKTNVARIDTEKTRNEWLQIRSENEAFVLAAKTKLEETEAKRNGQKGSLEAVEDDIKALQKDIARLGVAEPADILPLLESLRTGVAELKTEDENQSTLVEAITKKVSGEELQTATHQKKQEDLRDKFTKNSNEFAVTEVDERWGFVVISAGADSHIEPNSILLVKRNGTTIAQLKVTSIEKNQTIADLIPQTLAKGNRLMPGDAVIPKTPQS